MRIALIAATAVLALAGTAYAAAGKTALCHGTGSEENPFVVISVADPAVDSHLAHGDSFVEEDGSCGDGGIGGPQ